MVIASEGFVDGGLEIRETIEAVDEEAFEVRGVPDEVGERIAVGISEIPYRTCHPSGLVAGILVEIETTVESLLVLHEFADDIDFGHCAGVDEGVPGL